MIIKVDTNKCIIFLVNKLNYKFYNYTLYLKFKDKW